MKGKTGGAFGPAPAAAPTNASAASAASRSSRPARKRAR